MIKVAWISTVLPSYRISFIKCLSENNSDIHFTIIYGNDNPGYSAYNAYGVTEINNRVKNFFYPKTGKAIWQHGVIKRLIFNNYDIVIITEAIYNLTNWLVILVNRVLKKKTIVFGHINFTVSSTSTFSIKQFLRNILYKSADALFTYTDSGRQNALKVGILPNNIFVINNTLDTSAIIDFVKNIDKISLQNIKTRYKINSNKVLIYAGRLYKNKHVELLIEAFQLLKKNHVDLTLLIVGDGSEKEHLQNIAQNNCDIRFINYLPSNELNYLFQISTVTVIPAALGLICIHSFANGVPIITVENHYSHGPEVSYLSDDNSIKISNLDPQGFAEAIEFLLNNPNKLQNLKKGALKTAEKHSIEKSVNNFISGIKHTYNSMIKE